MTTNKKMDQCYLDYVSIANVHFECLIFTSVTLHINVWYWKIWWANDAMLPIFILHSHLWAQFLTFYLPNLSENKFPHWENANSTVTFVKLRKKQEHAFPKYFHANVNCKTDFQAQLRLQTTLNTDYMLRLERENGFSCFTNINLASLGKDAVKSWKFFTFKMGCQTQRKLRHAPYILGIPRNGLLLIFNIWFFQAFQETGV